jgi:hypothetical protein
VKSNSQLSLNNRQLSPKLSPEKLHLLNSLMPRPNLLQSLSQLQNSHPRQHLKFHKMLQQKLQLSNRKNNQLKKLLLQAKKPQLNSHKSNRPNQAKLLQKPQLNLSQLKKLLLLSQNKQKSNQQLARSQKLKNPPSLQPMRQLKRFHPHKNLNQQSPSQ